MASLRHGACPMYSLHVFLTGAFGRLGAHTLARLADRGCRITAFDWKTPKTRASRNELRRRYRFETSWGDLRDAESLHRVIAKAKPDAIIHLAEVSPPSAYEDPARARAVNVEGTRALLRAAAALPKRPHFILASSTHVHGPRNGSRPLPLLTADTPPAPADTYGRHKVLCEESLRASGLPFTILRLGEVLHLDAADPPSEASVRMSFELPAAGRTHPVDPRDAALAFAGAATIPGARGRTFPIGGGEDWRLRHGDLVTRLHQEDGLGVVPRSAYCLAHPEADAAWHFEDWMDTREAQELLQFQEHRLEDTLAERRARAGARPLLARGVAPLRRRLLLRHSAYQGRAPFLQSRPMWERLATIFDLDPHAE